LAHPSHCLPAKTVHSREHVYAPYLNSKFDNDPTVRRIDRLRQQDTQSTRGNDGQYHDDIWTVAPLAELVRLSADESRHGRGSSAAKTRLDQLRQSAIHNKILVQRRPAPHFLKYLQGSSSPSDLESAVRLFEYPDGTVKVLLSTVRDEGVVFYQVLGGDSKPRLIEGRDIHQAGIVALWEFRDQSRPESVALTQFSSLTVNRRWHTFGLTKPGGKHATSFLVRNRGDADVTLTLTETSCGCTGAAMDTDGRLLPGQTCKIDVTVETDRQTSFHESVTLQFVGADNKTTRSRLHLYGNQHATARLMPGSVEFGEVLQDNEDSVVHSVRIIEQMTDRFDVESVSVGNLPLKYSVIPPKGTRPGEWLLKLRIQPESVTSKVGTHHGVVRITTTSKYFAVLELPIRYVIPSRLAITPARASFGTVTLGSIQPQSIYITPKNFTSFKMRLLQSPDDCDVIITQTDLGYKITVQPMLQSTGAFSREITIEATEAGWAETAIIMCSGYVRE